MVLVQLSITLLFIQGDQTLPRERVIRLQQSGCFIRLFGLLVPVLLFQT